MGGSTLSLITKLSAQYRCLWMKGEKGNYNKMNRCCGVSRTWHIKHSKLQLCQHYQLLLVTEKNIGARQSKITMGMQCTNIFAIRSNRVVRLFPMGIGGKFSPSISVRKLILPRSGRTVYPLLKLLLSMSDVNPSLRCSGIVACPGVQTFLSIILLLPEIILWFIAYYNPRPRR